MTLAASIGYAQALNGREAGLQATHQALNRIGSGTPRFGFVIASHQYQAREVVSGVSSLLGDTPMIGFSSSVCLAGDGLHPNSVLVGLLAGDMQAETRWMPGVCPKRPRDWCAAFEATRRSSRYTRSAFLCRWFQWGCRSIMQCPFNRLGSACRGALLG